jgi:proteasome inhibitor subunit 1 (PI31)
VREYKTEIVDKLVPSLEGKPTLEQRGSTSDARRGERQQVNPPGIPAHPGPGDGGSQGFRGLPPTHPSIGAADLDPLAASPNAFRPPSLFGGGQPRGGMPGGMMMDPSQFPSHPGPMNPSPHGFHPPGARWDPITPFQPPGGGGGGFHPNIPRGGAFGGEPDNDEFMPPGMEGGNADFGIRFPGQHRGGGQGGAGGRGGFGGGGFGVRPRRVSLTHPPVDADRLAAPLPSQGFA